MGVSELRKLKQLEDENARWRRILVDLTLDKQILQEVVRKKDLKAVKRRELAAWMQERFKTSVRHSCELALLQRSVWYAKGRARDRSALRQRIHDIAMVGTYFERGLSRASQGVKQRGTVKPDTRLELTRYGACLRAQLSSNYKGLPVCQANEWTCLTCPPIGCSS